MDHRNKALVLASFIIFLTIPLLLGNVEGFEEADKYSPIIHSVQLQQEGKKIVVSRKLLKSTEAVVMDYDDAEPNPRHDPRRRRSNP